LKGARSGLFYEICRLIDELPSVEYVLLENSPVIRIRGLNAVRKELTSRGFKLKWGYFEARMVGALHKRKRWICFGYRTDTNMPLIEKKYLRFPWKKGFSGDLVIEKTDENRDLRERCCVLGNAIVPQMVRYAWNILTSHIKPGEVENIPILENNDKEVVLYDGGKYIKKKRWATPTYTRWDQYKILTYRGYQMLGNQIYYCKDLKVPESIPINKRDKYYRINPCFVEFLMGYPKDWTII